MIASANAKASVSGRLATIMLEWLIASDHLRADCDLVLVREVPGLDDDPLPPEVELPSGRRWKVARIDGDFHLRMTLVEAGDFPLLAFTPCDDASFAADLRERAALRYVIRPQARHTFGALIGADASGLEDDRFSQALRDVLDGGLRLQLLTAIRARTWGHNVRDSEAAGILCEAAFGFDDRYVEEKPGALLANWLRDSPLLTPSLFGIANEILRKRYPLYADLLDNAPDRTPRTAFTMQARHDVPKDPTFARLAYDAARLLRKSSPDVLTELLASAEAAYVAAGSAPIDAPLLRGAYLVKSRAIVHRTLTGSPPTTDDIEDLAAFLYFDPALLDGLVALARLGRGMATLEPLAMPTTMISFATRFRSDFAWLDRAARRVREAHFEDGECEAVARQLVERWYGLRDRWNEAFARALAIAWPKLFAQPGIDAPYVVSHALKHIVRPLATSGRRVFLVILDGCDLPTFLEIATALNGAGAPLPKLDVMFSAIPTVTSHARRAIFAGKIPKDGVGAADELDNPSGDRKAFDGQNATLEGLTRKLFLKGDLGDDGVALAATLAKPSHDIVAAVFNDVDDAIASKEHGVLSERTIERCTLAFRRAMFAAIDAEWEIVLTADHGHTPYRAPDIKISLANARYSELGATDVAPTGTLLFEKSVGAPYRIAAAYQLGAHSGPQHIGYHGGVSMEEMLVPFARYGKAIESDVREPKWWNDRETPSALILPNPPTVARSVPIAVAPRGASKAAESEAIQRCRAVLAHDKRFLEIFERVREGAPSLTASQLGSVLGIPPGRLRPIVTGLIVALSNAGIESPITIEDDPLVFRWRPLV